MRTYDLVMTHQLDADDLFIHRVQQHCAQRRLNFFLIEPLWVEAFRARLDRGEVRARVLLNMHSEHHQPEDVYHQLVRLASARGTEVIDPLDVALAAFDKARLHPTLATAGFALPPTLIVPRAQMPLWRLSEEDRLLLGTPFIVKPAMGYGRRGVVLDATHEADLQRSVAAWPDAHYLLQRRLVPEMVDGEPAYFRVYYVFGQVWICWWNCYTDRYRALTPAEEEAPELEPLRDLVRRLAALTRMRFFSSEIMRTAGDRLVLIDYVNDQCHMLAQSANPHIGVPDALVSSIAHRLVEAAHDLLRNRP